MLQTNTRKNYKILSLHNQFTLKKTFAFGGCEVTQHATDRIPTTVSGPDGTILPVLGANQ